MADWEDAPDAWEDAPDSKQGVASATGEASLNLISNALLTPFAGFKGLGKLATGGSVDEAVSGINDVMEEAYQPRGERGQKYAENAAWALNLPAEYAGKAGEYIAGNEGRFAGEVLGEFATDLLPFGLLKGKGKPKPKTKVPSKVESAVEELSGKAPEIAPAEIPNLKATEGLDGQMSLFDIQEEARVPMKYEAKPGDWRIDENGMPVRVDLSLDVQHAETPLQRDMWVDQNKEFAPMQETGVYDKKTGELIPSETRSLPEALDTMDWAHKRGALKQSGLMKGEIDATGEVKPGGELAAAALEANTPWDSLKAKGQRGGINPEVFSETFQKIKEIADGVKLIAQGLGDQLSIRAVDKDGNSIGGAIYEKTNKYDAPEQSDLYGAMVGSKKKGTATEIYKYAAELGNDVVPSKRRTAAGQKMWEGFEKKGLSSGMRIPKSQRGSVLVDWKQGKQVEQLKAIPGVNNRLREVANSMIESPEKAIELSKEIPDVQQNFVQKGINLMTKGGTYLKAKLNNPVVHFGVDRFLQADQLARAEISDKLHGSYLPAVRSLSKTERTEVFTLLNAADLNKRSITPEMMDRWGLSQKQKDFINLHQERMADVLDKINIARTAVGKKPISARDAYSAMNMTGDYRKVAYKTIDGVKEVVGVIGANTKGMGKNSLSALEKKMLEKDPTLEFGPLQEAGRGRTPKGSPHEAFMDVLKTLGEDNPNMKQFLDTLAEVAKDDPSNYLGMQKHTMQKKGVWGMEGRKPWLSGEENAIQFFENQAKYMESAYQWAQLTEAAKDVNHVLRDPAVIEKQGNAIKLTEEYMQNALGLNPSKVGEGLNKAFEGFFDAIGVGPSIPRNVVSGTKAVTNTALLSLNPAFLAINLLQPVAAMPGMSSMLNSLGVKSGHTFGLYELSKGTVSLSKKLLAPSKLTPVERGAFDYAKENHVYATDMVEHANQVKKGALYYTEKATQSPAAMVEQVTRADLYMGFVHMLDNAGYKGRELYTQAHRLTDMAMNNYAPIEKPTIYNALGPVGSVAYNLRSFAHNEISRWALYARELASHGDAKPLLTQMASTIALAGVMGLPFFSQWDDIYQFITSKLGKPRSLTLDTMEMSKQLGEKVSPEYQYALSHGLFSLAGVDLSKRIGLGDILPDTAADAAFAGGGKLASMAKGAYQFAKNPSEETGKSFAYNMAPAGFQGPLDRAWYEKGDLAYSKDPENLKPLARRNDKDRLFRALGFQGINESVQKTTLYEQKELSKLISEYRKKAMDTIAQDLFRNRPIDQKTIDRYFVDGQGDGKTFMRDLERMVQQQNMSPQDALMIRDAASKRIPQLMELNRITQ